MEAEFSHSSGVRRKTARSATPGWPTWLTYNRDFGLDHASLLNRQLYTAAWYLALPLVCLRLLLRGRRQRGYLQAIGQRFGFAYPPAPMTPLIWIHAVSVGETRAAQPLVQALLEAYPGHQLLLTQMTPTGRDTARQLFADPRIRIAYLPYDLPGACTRFLTHFRPRLGILMETELWPNLVHLCHHQNIPLLLANARLSARSARGYQRVEALARPTLAGLSAVGAQSEADATRLRTLGASPVYVTGNLKFDMRPPADQIALAAVFRERIGKRPAILLASSREGEEAGFIEAFSELAPEDVLLIVVPRHPQRFEEVAALVQRHGLRLQRRSEGSAVAPDTRVWLGDSMGEMYAYYGATDLTVMGGSWAPLGGQNPIEASAMGSAVVCGPHTFNFAQVTSEAEAAGALARAQTPREGISLALELLADAPRRQRMGSAGSAFAAAHRGATQRTLTLIAPFLDAV